MEIRTFCWSPVENVIVQIDYYVIWRDEAVPKKALAGLPGLAGPELVEAIEELGAMLYVPAAKTLVSYLSGEDGAARRAAAKALAVIGAEGEAPDIAPHLDDPDVVVRRHAARALEVAMPKGLAKEVAKHVSESRQDEAVRRSLIGALQFHAPEKLTRKTLLALLENETSPAVRQRAVYALGRVTTKKDVKSLASLFEREEDPYAMIRLAYTLNKLTGRRQNLGKRGPLATSEPGKRGEFVRKWLGR